MGDIRKGDKVNVSYDGVTKVMYLQEKGNVFQMFLFIRIVIVIELLFIGTFIYSLF